MRGGLRAAEGAIVAKGLALHAPQCMLQGRLVRLVTGGPLAELPGQRMTSAPRGACSFACRSVQHSRGHCEGAAGGRGGEWSRWCVASSGRRQRSTGPHGAVGREARRGTTGGRRLALDSFVPAASLLRCRVLVERWESAILRPSLLRLVRTRGLVTLYSMLCH